MIRWGIRIFNWQILVMICIAMAIVFCSSMTTSQAQISWFDHNLLPEEIPDAGVKVYFIQLMSGEATFIVLENGEHLLVDTGSLFSDQELLAFLDQHHIKHVDHLILTNAQDEHAGNFELVLQQYRPEHIYFPYYMQSYFEEMDLENQHLHALNEGDKLQFDEQVQAHILHPNGTLSLSSNDNSLVFQLLHDKQRFLFTGDIRHKVENRLIKQYSLRSEILKVANFGSNESSSQTFLEQVDAHLAVIFYRPQHYVRPEVLERLHESWIDVYSVRDSGHILVVSSGDDYDVFILPVEQDSVQS